MNFCSRFQADTKMSNTYLPEKPELSPTLISDDDAVRLQYAYGAVKKSLEAYVTLAGGYVIEAQLPFPVNSDSEIVSEFRKALQRGKTNGRKVRLTMIDHVTSVPAGVLIPVKELIKICPEEGVHKVFVDGAHGIGCVDVDMKEIGADF
ncbi:hypothetical protein WN944_003138 [Citrus x changshan-huyou]|uniref:Aminotransferase class V domain-containing protein n=1 Tax=Citrus x changshan-huyou TaxID=2935761 RepID=A0AAP0QF77_9ROSI